MDYAQFFFQVMLFLACLLLFWFAWYQRLNQYLVLTPLLVFVAHEVLLCWPGFLYAFANGLSHDIYPALVAVVGFVAFLCGFLFFYRDQRFINVYHELPVQSYSSRYYLIGFLFAGLFLILVGLYQYQGWPPILQILGQFARGNFNSQEIAEITSQNRFSLTKSHLFGGAYRGQGIMRVITRVGWPYLVCVSLLMYSRTRRLLWGVLLCISIGMAFIFIAGEGTRAPFLLSIVIVIVLVSLFRKLKISNIVGIAGLLFLVLVGLSVLGSKAVQLLEAENPLGEIANSVIVRFAANGFDDVAVIEFIRSGVLEYQWGHVHWGAFVAALPGVWSDQVSFDYKLYQLMYPGSTRTSYATTTYLGLMYADAGFLGVITIYFLLGLAMGYAQRLLFKRGKEVTQLVFLAFVIYYMGWAAIIGPIGFAVSYLMLWCFHQFFRMSARFGGGVYHLLAQASADHPKACLSQPERGSK